MNTTPARPPLSTSFVAHSYAQPEVVQRYVADAEGFSLWNGERELLLRHVPQRSRTLDLGCGAGRTTIGLSALGHDVHGIDISYPMIEAAQCVINRHGARATLTVADACSLPFSSRVFEAAIFSFNGLMQIPGAPNRLGALREIRRVLVHGGLLIFSTPGRETRSRLSREFWRQQREIWDRGKQNPQLGEFGDVLVKEAAGIFTFLHVPTRNEVVTLVAQAGLTLVECRSRRQLARETEVVENRLGGTEWFLWVARA